MKYYALILCLMFSLAFVSAFDFSYEDTWTYEDASAYGKVMGTYPVCDGNREGNVCDGTWYIDVDFEGTKLYIGYKKQGWDEDYYLNANGYSGNLEEINPGRINLEPEDGKIPTYIICSYACDGDCGNEQSDDYWAYGGICGGYLGDYFESLLISGFCNSDYDCKGEYIKQTYCNDNNIKERTIGYKCVSSMCNQEVISDKIIEECEKGCKDSKCITGYPDIYYQIGLLIITVVIFYGVVVLLRLPKGKRRYR
jgi:hypothetical protein